MFQSDCVVLLPFSEISIKGNQVRGFIEKRLRKNISFYLEHFNVPHKKIISRAGRMIIHSSEPKKVIFSLEKCFGISAFFLAKEETFSTLEDLCSKAVALSKGKVESETFAVRGKSFAKNISSKKLEEEIGGALLEKYPSLKVKLKNPEKEVFCVAFEDKAYFYFEKIAGAGGMPTGTQGRAGLLITKESTQKELVALGKDLLRVGCGLAFVSDEKKVPDLSAIEEFNSYKSLKVHPIKKAKGFYSIGEFRAFFSTASTIEQAESDSKLVGVKVFVPRLF